MDGMKMSSQISNDQRDLSFPDPLPPRVEPIHVPAVDQKRIAGQLERVRDCLAVSTWVTLRQISSWCMLIGHLDSEAGISARIRDLRRPEYGGHVIEKRRRVEGQGQWEYRMVRGGMEDDSHGHV